jgi:hypothetical protein
MKKMIGTDMKAISAKQIKNSLLSSAGFGVVNKPNDKPSTRTDVASNLAAMIYIRTKGALFYIDLKYIFPVYPRPSNLRTTSYGFIRGHLQPLRVRGTLASEDI